MLRDLECVLFPPGQIAERVQALANKITADYAGKPLVLVAVVNGAIPFVADLMRAITLPLEFESVRASSYGGGTESSGSPDIVLPDSLDIAGRHVMVVDDILDTGHTLSRIVAALRQHGAASVRTCVLLEKPARNHTGFQADYAGFTIPDRFVVGYGLDHARRYRNLPCIGVLKPPHENPATGNS